MRARVLARRTDSFWAERGKARAGSSWWREEVAEQKLERDARAWKNVAEDADVVAATEDDPAEESAPVRNGRIQQVPRTELELHRLLIRLARGEPPTSATKLSALHAHDVFRPLVSSRTYADLLHLAVRVSNQRLVRSLLQEMDERAVERTASVWRTLLRARMKVGDLAGVREAVAELGRHGVRPVVTLNWRRNLGGTARGKADPRRRDWAEWDKLKAESEPTAQPNASRKGARSEANNSTAVFSARDALFTRQQTRIHQAPHKLSHQDIAALIQSLILDGNAPDAFVFAEQWLDKNLPRAPRNASTAEREGRAYVVALRRHESTALVLLNILLRSLVSTCPVPSDLSIRAFVREFAARHGVRPGEVTLRELVDSYRYRPRNTARRNAWLFAKSAVEWFVRNFGVPGSPPPSTPTSAPPGRAAAAHLCSTQVSILLLNLAVHQPAGPPSSMYQKEFIWNLRTWWAQAKLHRLAREGTLGQLGNRRVGLLVDAAIRKGLLEEPEGWREEEGRRERRKQKREAREALWE